MIVFLTLCYVGILFLLIKLNLVRLNLWWKLSPVVWMIFLLVALFIPMQWGAPSGGVVQVNYVVEVVPNVSGEVVNVPVDPLKVLQPGDVLFEIDRTTFEAEVQRLESALAEAKTNVKRLEATAAATSAAVKRTEEQVDVLKSEQSSAAAQVEAAVAAVAEAEASRDATSTELVDRRRQLKFAQSDLARIEALVLQDAATPSDVDRAKVNVTSLEG
jgi:multidrug resistance efflux pump